MESRLSNGSFAAVLPFRNLQFEIFMNRASSTRFDLPLHHAAVQASLIEGGKHEIWIYRNNTLIKAGPLWDLTASSSGSTIACTAEDLTAYLEVNLIEADASFTDIDQGQIAWSLINTWQGLTMGTRGITQGSIPASVNRQRTYKKSDGKNIYEAIMDMVEQDNGFDFELTPQRVFNVYPPRRTRDRGLTLELGAGLRHISVNHQGKYRRSRVLMKGPEDTYVEAEDTVSRDTYGRASIAVSATDITSSDTLTERAGLERDRRRLPKVTPQISVVPTINPYDSDIRMGDTITIKAQAGYIQYNEQFRLVGWQTTVGAQGNESFVFYFNDDREVA